MGEREWSYGISNSAWGARHVSIICNGAGIIERPENGRTTKSLLVALAHKRAWLGTEDIFDSFFRRDKANPKVTQLYPSARDGCTVGPSRTVEKTRTGDVCTRQTMIPAAAYSCVGRRLRKPYTAYQKRSGIHLHLMNEGQARPCRHWPAS